MKYSSICGSSQRPYDYVLSKFSGAEADGDTINVLCPAHDDNRPTLAITEGDDGRVLMTCRAGCGTSEILGAVGLKMADLFVKKETRKGSKASSGRPVKSYPYRDESDQLLYEVCRYEPKDFRQRCPDAKGGYIWNLNGIRRVLYHLPRLMSASPDEVVFVVEGEKDVENLEGLGFVATCNVGGAGKWKTEYSEFLAGRDVVIIPDNDEPGRKHAMSVSESLRGVAKRVRLACLSDVAVKGDISDWVEARDATPTEDVRRELLRIVDESSDFVSQNSDEIIESDNDEWGEVIPLTSCKAASCPIECIPCNVRGYLEWAATFTQTPVDIAVGQWLAAAAIAVQQKFVVEPIPGWQEPLCLYLVSVMEPGNRKSAVAKMIGAPIRAYEKQQREIMAPSLRLARADHELKTKQRSKLIEDITKACGTDRDAKRHELDALDTELSNSPSLEELTMLVDDVTPEQIATLMEKNGGRLGILTAEGDLFDILAGRYSKQANIGTVLKAHCGDEIRVNRGNRSSELISNPTLTMGLAVQLNVLHGLLDKKEFRGRGLLARILFQIPTSPVGFREVDTVPWNAVLEQQYKSAMDRILQLPAEENADGYIPQSLTLSPEAFKRFRDYRIRNEASLREFGDLDTIKDWGGKLPGAVARIAGLLHLIQYADGNHAPLVIGDDTMKHAIVLGDYFSNHALTAFQVMGHDENRMLAETIVSAIKRNRLHSFTRRDLHQIVRRHVKNPDDLDEPLELVAEHGIIRKPDPSRRDRPKNRGRLPSTAYETNPRLFEAIA